MIPLYHKGHLFPPPPPYRHDPRLDDLQNAKEEIEWLKYDRGRWRGFAFALAVVLLCVLPVLTLVFWRRS